MVGYFRPGGQGVGAIWTAMCDCGRETRVRAKEAAAGRITSCQKCDTPHKLRAERISFSRQRTGVYSRLWARDYRRALKEGVQWLLTEAQYRVLIEKECLYCGIQPSIHVPRSKLKVNHVIRMNYTEGYHLGNVAPCCSTCERWKKGSTSEDFVARLLYVATRISNILNPTK